MFDFIGQIIAGTGAIIIIFNKSHEIIIFKKYFKGNLSLHSLAKGLIIIGIIFSVITTYINNKSDEEHKNATDTIDTTTRNIYNETTEHDSISNDFYIFANISINDLIDASKLLGCLIIEQSDSSLKTQLELINNKLVNVKDTLELQKEIAYRYYFVENWPTSEKDFKKVYLLDSFISPQLWGILDGVDLYIIWKLIQENGKIAKAEIDNLHDEIWSYLKPMKLSIGISLNKLKIMGIINFNYWQGDLEFSDYYKKRYDIYKRYYENDRKRYQGEMNELYYNHTKDLYNSSK